MSKELLNKEININPLQLVDKYKASLRIKGLLTASGRVRQSELYKQFVSYYGIELLGIFQSVPQIEKESCWLKTITRKHRISFHPMRQLLLMNFLEIELNEVEKIDDAGPFGKGPFPCLNNAAEHYKKLVVNDLQIKRCTDTGNPLGTFNCKCGFKYTRLGPDYFQEEIYNYRFIRDYGEVWVNKLREYVDKDHMSFRKAARLLQVDTGTAIKYYNQTQIDVEKNEPLIKNIEYYRESWLSIRSKNPNFSKTMLRKLNPKIYFWLYRNDREWLDINSPSHINRVKIKTRVDWKERDFKLVEDIQTYLQTINKSEKPKRITKRSIAVSIGKLSLIETHLSLTLKLALLFVYLANIL